MCTSKSPPWDTVFIQLRHNSVVKWNLSLVKFEVLTTVTVTITVLRVVIPCTLAEVYWLFREASCLVWMEVWQQVRVRRRYAVPYCRLSHPKWYRNLFVWVYKWNSSKRCSQQNRVFSPTCSNSELLLIIDWNEDSAEYSSHNQGAK
jgi:hypothetical protein